MAKKITFITGGAKSGKSGFALREAASFTGKKAFIATACASDPEMARRIARHKADRGASWDTFEEPLAIAGLLRELAGGYDLIVLDCLTLWLNNLLLDGINAEAEIGKLVASLSSTPQGRIYIVTNEVGSGIVPENELARRFLDLAGVLHQQIAMIADEVYLLVAGIPVKIKGDSK